MKDYYKILGVEKNATEEDIKKAYRRLAHKHHPDKSGGDSSKFKEVNEAYQVLSNKEKRANYDRFGTAEPGFGAGSGFGSQAGWQQGFGGNTAGWSNVGDLGDIFESIFEGFGQASPRRTYHRGNDLETAVKITLEDAMKGINKTLTIPTLISCEKCKGEGGDPKAGSVECSVCDGRGDIKEDRRTFFGSFSQVKQCAKCHGSGKIPKKTCEKCKGEGRVKGEREVSFDIIKGIRDGQIIQVKGMGEAGGKGAESGDLYIRVKINPHKVFQRQGDHLIVKKEIRITDILLGKKIEIPLIEGGSEEIVIPEGFELGDLYRIPGKGMSKFRASGRGDLLVDFSVKAPKKPRGKAKELLEELEKEL